MFLVANRDRSGTSEWTSGSGDGAEGCLWSGWPSWVGGGQGGGGHESRSVFSDQPDAIQSWLAAGRTSPERRRRLNSDGAVPDGRVSGRSRLSRFQRRFPPNNDGRPSGVWRLALGQARAMSRGMHDAGGRDPHIPYWRGARVESRGVFLEFEAVACLGRWGEGTAGGFEGS